MSKGKLPMKKIFHFIKNNFLALFFGTLLLWILSVNIMEQFVWETRLAYHMNSVPIFFYMILFLILPFTLIEKIYKDKFTEEETPYRQKCTSPTDVGKILLGGILKLALIIILPFAILILSSFLCTIVLEDAIPMENPYILYSHFQYLPLFSGIGLLLMFIWLFSKKGLVIRDYSEHAKTDFFTSGEKAHLPFSIKCRIALISTLVFLFTLFIPVCSYDCITETGVIRHCFFYDKTYTWEDAAYYSLRSIDKGTLALVIEMKDSHMVFWDSCLSDNLPEDVYPNHFYDFSVHLAETLHEQGVPFQMKYWDKFYENLEFEEDMQYALKIKQISEGN